MKVKAKCRKSLLIECGQFCLTDWQMASHNMRPSQPEKYFEFYQMIIAQTGLNSNPLSNSQPSANSVGYGFWWLLPISVVGAGIVWYLRRQMIPPEKRSSSKNLVHTKSAANKAKNTSSSENLDVTASANRRVSEPKKVGKKKKKDRSNSERRTQTVVSSLPSTPEIKKDSTGTLTPISIAQTLARPESMSQTSAPNNAIFEPLREVVQQRRKSTFSTASDFLQSNESVVSSLPSGGKFERTVAPSAATRLVANRWPTPATQPLPTAKIATPHPKASLAPNPVSSPVPVPVQEKGLKSFVSKVKNSASANTDPEN